MLTPGMIKTRLLLKKAEIEAGFSRTHKQLGAKNELAGSDATGQLDTTENDERFYSLAREELAELAQINRALKRLEEGQYTKCSCCWLPITERRLQAFPTTELCYSCASKAKE